MLSKFLDNFLYTLLSLKLNSKRSYTIFYVDFDAYLNTCIIAQLGWIEKSLSYDLAVVKLPLLLKKNRKKFLNIERNARTQMCWPLFMRFIELIEYRYFALFIRFIKLLTDVLNFELFAVLLMIIIVIM